MYYLLLLFGAIAMAAGVFVVAFGIPIRESPFGAALLIAGSVSITGGFIVVGLAAAVQELQRVVQGLKTRGPVPRPLRPVERKDGKREEGAERRPGPPRIPMPARPGVAAPNLMPTNLDASPDAQPQGQARKPGPDWLRRAVAEIESAPRPVEAAPGGPDTYRNDPDSYRNDDVRPLPPDVWPRANPSPEPAVPEVRQAPAASQQNIFDMVWPSDRRRADAPPEKRFEAPLETPMRPIETRPPPPAPAPPPVAPPAAPPARVEQRPLSILKSGVIDEMAYTLFTDGSIEAQMPDGTMRFASIDELRQHLEKHES
jgi:hypothetical protein